MTASHPRGVSEAGGSYRTPAFEHATVADAMRPGVISCPADTPLRKVARMMSEQHIHCVVVADLDRSDGLGWGIVSDVDLLEAAGGEIDDETAGSVAATEPITAPLDESLERAAQLMAEHGVTHLVVVTRGSGHPLGVLSSLDIAGIIAWGRA